MGSGPVLSVISPVYNKEGYLGQCVASCLSQTLRDIELIFIDDGSTDGSLGLLKELAARDGRIRVLTQENGGAASARNKGIDEARGEFVFFLDSDDYIPETTALERLYESAKTNGTLIAGGSMTIDRGGKLDSDSLHGRALDSFEREEVVSYLDYQYDYDYTRYIYSLGLLREHDIRFPALRQFEDPVFFVRAMLAAGVFSTIPDAVYAYRVAYRVEAPWSERMVLDRVRGGMELLELSRALGLARLHAHVVGQLDGEMRSAFLDNAGSAAVLSAMCRANAAVDVELLRKVNPSQPQDYVFEGFRRMGRAQQRRRWMRDTLPGRVVVFLKRRLVG